MNRISIGPITSNSEVGLDLWGYRSTGSSRPCLTVTMTHRCRHGRSQSRCWLQGHSRLPSHRLVRLQLGGHELELDRAEQDEAQPEVDHRTVAAWRSKAHKRRRG